MFVWCGQKGAAWEEEAEVCLFMGQTLRIRPRCGGGSLSTAGGEAPQDELRRFEQEVKGSVRGI